MLLNMFFMSRDTSERVGKELLVCGIVMYFSTPFLIVEITMSHPPCTPTAKLYGSKSLANRGVNCFRSAIAVMRRIAEGIPNGRSLVLSFVSFSSATRYVVRSSSVTLEGTSALAMFWKNCVTSAGFMLSVWFRRR